MTTPSRERMKTYRINIQADIVETKDNHKLIERICSPEFHWQEVLETVLKFPSSLKHIISTTDILEE